MATPKATSQILMTAGVGTVRLAEETEAPQASTYPVSSSARWQDCYGLQRFNAPAFFGRETFEVARIRALPICLKIEWLDFCLAYIFASLTDNSNQFHPHIHSMP
ncbi:hypothetical protein MGYG_05365 [Nannizzia gypsea CBS 118893]|uniref:Uncharacterized protein n=1 Tax=Arthroderma gypseum (strain ATCC MYA-4604 / CBS 118893) TaxID=535722 RepID=E4UVP2_ARTGP|nr:hypothetical protein MGYG_05365 [Nannizzia gypsea CBS 118893]EFR02369.1 hypothetical protein MGYG_05365 [Nannizzia gypsea CBS 118893]